jgi:hypothetical protein
VPVMLVLIDRISFLVVKHCLVFHLFAVIAEFDPPIF